LSKDLAVRCMSGQGKNVLTISPPLVLYIYD